MQLTPQLVGGAISNETLLTVSNIIMTYTELKHEKYTKMSKRQLYYNLCYSIFYIHVYMCLKYHIVYIQKRVNTLYMQEWHLFNYAYNILCMYLSISLVVFNC